MLQLPLRRAAARERPLRRAGGSAPGEGYTPGACAGPDAAATPAPLARGSFHEGVPPPATGGQPADGMRRLVDTEIWLASLDVGVATIDAARSRHSMPAAPSGSAAATPPSTCTGPRSSRRCRARPPARHRRVHRRAAGLGGSRHGRGDRQRHLRRRGPIPYRYSVDAAGRLVIDVPIEGFEGVLRMYFE
ncbi:MAG: hypothetical protein R3F43_03200 [bacterium]